VVAAFFGLTLAADLDLAAFFRLVEAVLGALLLARLVVALEAALVVDVFLATVARSSGVERVRRRCRQRTEHPAALVAEVYNKHP